MATEIIIPSHEVKLGANVSIPGGFTPIPDAEHNAQIIALATWAIDEHNKQTKYPQKLVKVISASQKVLADTTMYIIKFEAMHLYVLLPIMVYEAKVVETCNFKKLVEFNEISNAA